MEEANNKSPLYDLLEANNKSPSYDLLLASSIIYVVVFELCSKTLLLPFSYCSRRVSLLFLYPHVATLWQLY